MPLKGVGLLIRGLHWGLGLSVSGIVGPAKGSHRVIMECRAVSGLEIRKHHAQQCRIKWTCKWKIDRNCVIKWGDRDNYLYGGPCFLHDYSVCTLP